MSFNTFLSTYKNFPLEKYIGSVQPNRIESILNKRIISIEDFLCLLSDSAQEYIEPLAQKSAELTRQNFGHSISLFTPLYIANYCQNNCLYCSFSKEHTIKRRQLSFQDLHTEAQAIRDSGIRHILVLTGEAPTITTFDYIRKSLKILSTYFSSIGIEMYPLKEKEYKELIDQGYIDSLTIYQETYNKTLYNSLHTKGPKSDYLFRLDTADRACKNHIHAITIGPLLGLDSFQREAFYTALHASYIQRCFPSVELSLSFPRIRPMAGDYSSPSPISDSQFVQLIAALRLLFPTVGMTLSTRESAYFRNNLIPLGITKISAGVSTAVGGYSVDNPSTTQFEISDNRSVLEMKNALVSLGFQPVMHDWNLHLHKT